MNIGMLWYFDKDEKGIMKEAKDAIKDAMNYYIGKYGLRPTICVLHPAHSLPDGTEYLKIENSKYIRPNHCWIGVADEPVELPVLQAN